VPPIHFEGQSFHVGDGIIRLAVRQHRAGFHCVRAYSQLRRTLTSVARHAPFGSASPAWSPRVSGTVAWVFPALIR
jgi:hypothetical protein